MSIQEEALDLSKFEGLSSKTLLFLMSARETSVAWRLGKVKADFESEKSKVQEIDEQLKGERNKTYSLSTDLRNKKTEIARLSRELTEERTEIGELSARVAQLENEKENGTPQPPQRKRKNKPKKALPQQVTPIQWYD
ncbi:hypothetical protein DL96DRAFT_1713106 [Flagelloscypha sp. PMI_526]|nr:hypothetical protein DL96DRAFT_1713106 [Flagelloscypha sp. PMI_526]